MLERVTGTWQGELFSTAVAEHARDAAWQVVGVQRLRRLVEERAAGGDVEPGFGTVPREGGVAPFAIELVGAQERASRPREAFSLGSLTTALRPQSGSGRGPPGDGGDAGYERLGIPGAPGP